MFGQVFKADVLTLWLFWQQFALRSWMFAVIKVVMMCRMRKTYRCLNSHLQK